MNVAVLQTTCQDEYVYADSLALNGLANFDRYMGSVEPIGKRLESARAKRKWSRERLSHEAFPLGVRGTSVANIAAIERGARHPSPRTITALAQVLELEEARIPEIQLAEARRQLDEREVGLQQALATLRRLELAAIAGGFPLLLPDLDPEELQRVLGDPQPGQREDRVSKMPASPQPKRSKKRRAS